MLIAGALMPVNAQTPAAAQAAGPPARPAPVEVDAALPIGNGPYRAIMETDAGLLTLSPKGAP